MLYVAMKSQREMMVERNNNWEVALRQMATWILTKSGLSPIKTAKDADAVDFDLIDFGPGDSKKSLNDHVGPMVGEALSLIGQHLVDDFMDDQPKVESGLPTTSAALLTEVTP
jgi:hypothetical protein